MFVCPQDSPIATPIMAFAELMRWIIVGNVEATGLVYTEKAKGTAS